DASRPTQVAAPLDRRLGSVACAVLGPFRQAVAPRPPTSAPGRAARPAAAPRRPTPPGTAQVTPARRPAGQDSGPRQRAIPGRAPHWGPGVADRVAAVAAAAPLRRACSAPCAPAA